MPKDNINKTEIINKVFPVIKKAVEEANLVLLEVDFVQEFNKWHLRIYIYNSQKTVTHEDCQKVTAELSEYIDELIPIPFYLEVSSPGTERKLKSSQEYTIFCGNRVKVKLKRPVLDNLKVLVGTIQSYNQEKGLIIKLEENEQFVEIEENNISSVKLEPKYKY